MRRWIRGLFATVVTVCVVAACAAPGGAPPKGESPPVASEIMDRNRNKVFDDLDRMILLASTEVKVPVVVLMDQQRAAAELERRVGSVDVVREFHAVPAIALRATRAQIEGLAELPFVRQIEVDATVSVELNGASWWFGATSARQDFGVDGDRDGRPASYSKSDVVVAVIDTGIDTRHVDLDGGKVIAWQDLVNSQTTPYDDHGHGTHVASTVAGTGEGNADYKGVAPGAALVGIKVLDRSGRGAVSNLIAAVEWCIDNRTRYGIRVLSMSLGVRGSSDGTDTLSQVINRAVDAGIVAVVAAGNEGPDFFTIGTPGAAAKAITVGAMADVSEGGFYQAIFSSRGPTADDRTKPDVSAPGVRITAAQAGSGNRYISYDGTSMATPFVSGTVALMLDANPNLTPVQVKDILRRTAQDRGPDGEDHDYGAGRLDSYAAVKQAGNLTGTGPVMPTLMRFTDSLTAPGWQDYFLDVTSTQYPIAITMLSQAWGSEEPAIAMYLYNPQGSEIGRSTSTTRQQTITVRPSYTGRYRILVQANRGSVDYTLDASGGFASASDRAPSLEILAPPENSSVSGFVKVRIAASDDRKVEQVEVQEQTWVNITSSFDGTYYHYLWDTTRRSDGEQFLPVRAVDSGGQETQVRRRYIVANRTGGQPQKEMTGSVSPSEPEAWHAVYVSQPGWLDLALSWGGGADLDYEVYGPDDGLAARAFSAANPELLRVRVAATGYYRIKVTHFGGEPTTYRLAARALGLTPLIFQLTPQSPVSQHEFFLSSAGEGLIEVMAESPSDVDFALYNPAGQLAARGASTLNPEVSAVNWDPPGAWLLKVNLAEGGPTYVQVNLYFPVGVS